VRKHLETESNQKIWGFCLNPPIFKIISIACGFKIGICSLKSLIGYLSFLNRISNNQLNINKMNSIQTNLSQTASVELQKLMNALDLTIEMFNTNQVEHLSLNTYKDVCEQVGITRNDFSDMYGVGNDIRDEYEEQGRMFTVILLAINHKRDEDGFFWVDFIFFEDGTAELAVSCTTVESRYCEDLLHDITGFNEEHVFTHEEATNLLKELYERIKEDPGCFQKFWQLYY